MNNDKWIPACGGTEVPFKTRNGRTLVYMWNQTTGEHAYYDCSNDLFLSTEEYYQEVMAPYQHALSPIQED